MITAAQIRAVAPLARADLVKVIVDNWSLAEAAQIVTPLRIAHFFAQICTETGGLASVSENMNYSAERLREVWPTRFPTPAAAAPYAHNPQKLAEKVYGGRLGNNRPGDGYLFRGGGMMQTTGRDNYRAMGFEANPDALRDPLTALKVAIREWVRRGCNALADRDDVEAARRAINGGLIGLSDCIKYLRKAKVAFRAPKVAEITLNKSEYVAFASMTDQEPVAATPAIVTPGAADIVRADIDPNAVQADLASLGYFVGEIGDRPGGKTVGAISAFRLDRGIGGEAVIDQDLVDEIARAKAAGWSRPITPARKEASAATVAAKVPEAQSARRGTLVSAWLTFLTFMGGVLNFVKDNIATARDYISPFTDMVSGMPAWFWFAATAVVLLVLWWTSSSTQKQIVDAFRSGERN